VGTPVRARNWRECPPQVCVVEAARRIVFVPDFGASPEVRKRELENEFARFLAGQSRAFVRSILVSTYSTGVPLKCSISTQEQSCGPAQEFPEKLIHPDKYHLRQYLADKPNPELRPVLHLI
jgi:hypothetical protein